MSNDNNAFVNELARAFGESLADPVYARLGDPTRAIGSNIDASAVTGKPGAVFVHARSDGEGGVSVVLRKPELLDRVMVFGTPVKLQWENGELVLVGTDTRDAQNYFAGVPIDTQAPIGLDKLAWGLLQATTPPTMRAFVTEAVYTIGDTDYYVPGLYTDDFSTSPDDSSSNPIDIPGAGDAILITVQIDPATAALSYVQSTAFDIELTIAQVLEAGLNEPPDTGYFRVGYIKLPNGVTALRDGVHLYPAGQFLGAPGASGPVTPYVEGTAFVYPDFTEITIAAGVAAVTQALHTVAAESGTADDLDTLNVSISGVTTPFVIILRAAAGDTITVKHSTGNIELNGAADYALSGDKTLALLHDGTIATDLSIPGASGTFAPVDATYITQTSNGTLTNEQALSSLQTGAMVVTNSTGVITSLKHNLSASVGPGATDDNTAGYSIGSMWINTTDNRIYFCIDNATSAAYWITHSMQIITLGTLGSAAASVSITNIPQRYQNLRLITQVRSARTGNTFDNILFRLNGNTTAGNYFAQVIAAAGTTLSGLENIGATATMVNGVMPAANATANLFSNFDVMIPNYTNSSIIKSCNWTNHRALALSSGNLAVNTGYGVYNSTSAVTQIDFLAANGNLVAGTWYVLFGEY